MNIRKLISGEVTKIKEKAKDSFQEYKQERAEWKAIEKDNKKKEKDAYRKSYLEEKIKLASQKGKENAKSPNVLKNYLKGVKEKQKQRGGILPMNR